MEEIFKQLKNIPQDARAATKHVLSLLLDKIHPLLIALRNKIENSGEDLTKVREVYTLCSSQIKKCLINLFDVFKLEAHQGYFLQDSRQYTVERLSWCINRLITIEKYMEKSSNSTANDDSADDSINVTTMYFVNWIDHTFQVLGKLSDAVYRTDYKESEEKCELWKNEIVECISELHISIDELLLSAMTLCKYCLSEDQHIVKARCQVVLRETKVLLSELVEGDLNNVIKATPDTLKLPIMPSNVNVLIDVLKDVLYALETNTNTALLALVAHCFSYNKSPIEILKGHFDSDTKGTCSCLVKSGDDLTEDCSFVKEFDLYNERLLQIGNFAVSCSSDQHRILNLRSGLASLEALDPHLVPALMMSPDSLHAKMLISSWTHEVQDIRDSIYLIVDPTAFSEKAKQMMHQTLLAILNENTYNNAEVSAVINIGCMVYNFFMVYEKCEPDALVQHDKLLVLMADLDKVQKECKIVSNLLSSKDDAVYDIKMPTHNKEVSIDQLLKRLKLLYTLVKRIHALLCPKDNDDEFEDENVDQRQMAYKNTTHTVLKNYETYVNSPRKLNNISRSLFARTNIRSSTKNFPLSKLTTRFKSKVIKELNFSAQLDQLFDETSRNVCENKPLNKINDPSLSVLYNSPMKNRPSLRRAVLNRQCKIPAMADLADTTYDKDSLMDATTSFQITDILNQMNDMTNMLSTSKISQQNPVHSSNQNNESKNVLWIKVNNQNTTISKHIWNIPVNASYVEMPLEDDSASIVSQLSDVNTLERIHDLDFVESKLNSLKSQLETSL